jgi:predicted nucleotidyltransferase
VRSLDLFGSVARGEAKPESDVDLLVEFEEVPGFVGYLRLRNRLQEILGRPVDLVMASGLRPRIRERVLREGTACRVTGACGSRPFFLPFPGRRSSAVTL